MIQVWQSRVGIEGYSVAYFDRITAFEAPYRWTSIKGGAHTHFVDAWISNESTKCIWAPPLTEAQRYGTSTAAKRSKYATVDFYTGLPHILILSGSMTNTVPWRNYMLTMSSFIPLLCKLMRTLYVCSTLKSCKLCVEVASWVIANHHSPFPSPTFHFNPLPINLWGWTW